jgi:anoctamin-10
LTNSYPGKNPDFSASPLNPADRIRLVHSYITTSTAQGGLGIDVGSDKWPHVKSVFILHDRAFNHTWISNWTKRQIGFHITFKELDVIKEQFGEAVALYYSFLSSYATALVFPAFVGVAFWKFENPYSPVYSVLVVIWSVIFVEWWRIRERKLSVRWGTRGAAKVEKIRIKYHPTKRADGDEEDAGFPWWKREFRIITSLPVIGTAALILAMLLTGIFILEAFVTQLYTGPGHQIAALVPTILFAGLVPQFLAVYQKIASALSELI